MGQSPCSFHSEFCSERAQGWDEEAMALCFQEEYRTTLESCALHPPAGKHRHWGFLAPRSKALARLLLSSLHLSCCRNGSPLPLFPASWRCRTAGPSSSGE